MPGLLIGWINAVKIIEKQINTTGAALVDFVILIFDANNTGSRRLTGIGSHLISNRIVSGPPTGNIGDPFVCGRR